MRTRALIAGLGVLVALPAAAHRGGPNIMEEGQLIRDAHHLRGIPGVVVQGRHDVATPAATAWAPRKAWPEAAFHLVPDAGHAFGEPGILHRPIEATDAFAAAGPGGTPR
jgi:pimeloyl-ACP methyl ester carboxylesterase